MVQTQCTYKELDERRANGWVFEMTMTRSLDDFSFVRSWLRLAICEVVRFDEPAPSGFGRHDNEKRRVIKAFRDSH